jgi:hypothetical protein
MKAELFYTGGTKWTSGDQSQLCAKNFLFQLVLSVPGILTRNPRLVFCFSYSPSRSTAQKLEVFRTVEIRSFSTRQRQATPSEERAEK